MARFRFGLSFTHSRISKQHKMNPTTSVSLLQRKAESATAAKEGKVKEGFRRWYM